MQGSFGNQPGLGRGRLMGSGVHFFHVANVGCFSLEWRDVRCEMIKLLVTPFSWRNFLEIYN